MYKGVGLEAGSPALATPMPNDNPPPPKKKKTTNKQTNKQTNRIRRVLDFELYTRPSIFHIHVCSLEESCTSLHHAQICFWAITVGPSSIQAYCLSLPVTLYDEK